MDEMPSLSKDKMYLAGMIVNSMIGLLAQQVITGIRKLPLSSRNDRADAGLANIWEEFKYQFQKEHSTYEDFYGPEVCKLCEDAVGSLIPELQQLLWLWTDEFDDLWVEQDEVKLGNWNLSDVVNMVYSEVCHIATDEPLDYNPFDEEARLRFELDHEIQTEQFGED